MEQIIYLNHYSWNEVETFRKSKKLCGLIQQHAVIHKNKLHVFEKPLENSIKISVTFWESK